MTPTEQARRSDSLYQGSINRRELCDMVAHLEADSGLMRELLTEMAKRVTNKEGGCLAPGCALGCPHFLDCDEELGTCWYVDRLREVGIRVT